MLFHVSEEAKIERFEPRFSAYTKSDVVGAIDSEHLPNYLVPRECPRVTYRAGQMTNPADTERFLSGSSVVIAVESRWLEKVRSCRLYCYHLSPETFECFDTSAGYFVSHVPVVPIDVEVIEDSIMELLKRGVELRFVHDLRPLRDAVVASTLDFSIVRMRNGNTGGLGDPLC